jgi:hypothetical protein
VSFRDVEWKGMEGKVPVRKSMPHAVAVWGNVGRGMDAGDGGASNGRSVSIAVCNANATMQLVASGVVALLFFIVTRCAREGGGRRGTTLQDSRGGAEASGICAASRAALFAARCSPTAARPWQISPISIGPAKGHKGTHDLRRLGIGTTDSSRRHCSEFSNC